MRFGKSWIGICLIALAGCQKPFEPSNTSGYSVSQVENDARLWKKAAPGREWKHVAPTGSMKPFLNENCIVLLQQYTGQEFKNGQVVVFDRGDVINVIHTAVEQNGDMVYISGYNNHVSDGWFPKSKIAYLEAGILFTKPE